MDDSKVIKNSEAVFPLKGFCYGIICALIAAVWILVTSRGVKNQILSNPNNG